MTLCSLGLGLWACAHAPVAVLPSLFPLTPAWSLGVDAPLDAPLASDGTRIYVATRDGRVQAIAAADGAPVWRRAFPAGSSVAAGSEAVVVRQPGGLLTRLVPESGRDLWSRPTGIEGSLPATLAGEHVFVAGDGIAMLDLNDGRALWGAPGAPRVVAAPVARATRVFVIEEGGVLRARELQTGTPIWSFKSRQALVASVAADETRVYLPTTDRRIVALSADHGRVVWRWTLGADVQVPPVLAGRLVLVTSYDDVLYALDRSGRLVWRAPLPSRPLSSPLTISESAVIVACRETDIGGFELATGLRLGAMKTSGEMRVAPLVVGDRLIVGLRAPWTVNALALSMIPRARPTPAPPTPRPGVPAAPAAPSPTPTPTPTPTPAA
jgi:outer membrane protein assembly factor BamB